MSGMKLLAPISSFESAKLQISAGADEVYVGLKSKEYNNFSFSGRGQIVSGRKSICPDDNELREIVKYAHEYNVKVSLAANTTFLSEAYSFNAEQIYLDYIERGINCDIDNIIIGDIGLIHKVSAMNYPINIHASTFLDTMNTEQIKLLKELGVKRTVLTYQMSDKEIKKICEQNIMEIEVFGYMGCSFFNGACNLIHDMGGDHNFHIGTPCKAIWEVEFGGKVGESRALDAGLLCALCALKRLDIYGVNVIKIAGREQNPQMISTIVKLFRTAMDARWESEMYKAFINSIVPSWWKKIYCRNQKCKYEVNEITNSYIGTNCHGY